MAKKPDFLKNLDGTGRLPRQVQTDFLTQLAENWDDARVHAASLPVASGKSMIAKAIQNVTGASIITPQNILIDQYSGDYPDTNSLKGAAHYECCTYPGLSCEDVRNMLDGQPCGNCVCPYADARRRAQEEPTFFNPLSLFYCPPKKDGAESDTIIIDEAHSLLSMLRDLTTKTFSKRKWGFDPDQVATEVGFDKWLARQITKLQKLKQQYTKSPKEFSKIHRELTSLSLLQSALRFDMQNYVISIDEEFNPRTGHDVKLSVAPILVPSNIIQRLLGERRIILLSGTLFSEDIKELVGHKTTKYYDLPSPIPVANRPIYYRPIAGKMNRDTPITDVVAMIEEDLQVYPNVNTIIHTTYGMQEKIVDLLRLNHSNVLANTSENKQETLTAFKENGGIFVACGCSEGLDLKDDIARLNIIPKIDMPNLGDKTVIKRKALDRGESWYRQQGLKLTIQRAGRTTRHEKDHSVTIVHDPNLPRLILDEQKSGGLVPKYFTESMVWGK
jgi:Rad3-related DNA helicase